MLAHHPVQPWQPFHPCCCLQIAEAITNDELEALCPALKGASTTDNPDPSDLDREGPEELPLPSAPLWQQVQLSSAGGAAASPFSPKDTPADGHLSPSAGADNEDGEAAPYL